MLSAFAIFCARDRVLRRSPLLVAAAAAAASAPPAPPPLRCRQRPIGRSLLGTSALRSSCLTIASSVPWATCLARTLCSVSASGGGGATHRWSLCLLVLTATSPGEDPRQLPGGLSPPSKIRTRTLRPPPPRTALSPCRATLPTPPTRARAPRESVRACRGLHAPPALLAVHSTCNTACATSCHFQKTCRYWTLSALNPKP